MGKIIVVTGGARSGKSGYAEDLAKKLGEKILYIATAIPFDGEMQDRIKKHRKSRPEEWDTYEGFLNLHQIILSRSRDYNGILLDCVTVMLTNIMFNHKKFDENNIELELVKEIELEVAKNLNDLIKSAKEQNIDLIMVTNEVGSGIVPESAIGRIFRDLAGRSNQLIAKQADEVYLLVSGIPVKVK